MKFLDTIKHLFVSPKIPPKGDSNHHFYEWSMKMDSVLNMRMDCFTENKEVLITLYFPRTKQILDSWTVNTSNHESARQTYIQIIHAMRIINGATTGSLRGLFISLHDYEDIMNKLMRITCATRNDFNFTTILDEYKRILVESLNNS